MNFEIQNVSRRLVSVHCNSGKTCHLPPGYKHQVPEQEIIENSSVKKLKDRKLIAVRQLTKKSSSKPAGKDIGEQEAKPEKEEDTKKPSRKKSQSTK